MTPPREPRTAAGRANCECGASVLVENMENHLLRQSNGPHRFSSWPMPRTKAGRRLSESLEMMGPSPQQLDAAILAIEAEATDAPLREALETQVRHWRIQSSLAGSQPVSNTFDHCANELEQALTATPAPAPLDVTALEQAIRISPTMNSRPWRTHKQQAEDLAAAYARLTARTAATEDTDAE